MTPPPLPITQFNVNVEVAQGVADWIDRQYTCQSWSIQFHGVLSLTLLDGTVQLFGIGAWRYARIQSVFEMPKPKEPPTPA